MKSKIILITGAGAGIGKSLALKLAKKGHNVYAGVRDLKRAKKDFGKNRNELNIVLLDVNKSNHIKKAISQIISNEGRIDVLVNNAGFGMYGAFEELTDKQIRAQMETNFFACLNLCRAVIPTMKKQGSGTIFNISSILGLQALPTGTAYTSSKFALEGFSESLRYELFCFGIQVSLIEPGLIRTNFKKNMETSKNLKNKKSDYSFLNEMIGREYKGISASADYAAKKIAKIIQKKNPAIRYRIGLDSHLVRLLQNTTPDFFRDFITKLMIKSLYKKMQKA